MSRDESDSGVGAQVIADDIAQGAGPNERAEARPSGVIAARVGSWLVFLLEFTMVVLGLSLFGSTWSDEALVRAFIIFDAAAMAYIAIGYLVLRRQAEHEPDRVVGAGPDLWDRFRIGSAFRRWFPGVISLVGLSGSLDVFLSSDSAGKTGRTPLGMAAVVAVVVTWLLLHVAFARLYHYQHQADPNGLAFPETDHPNLIDFVYFSFTIGATFAVSDVAATNSRWRWRLTVHAVVSFFYNAVVLAIALKVITGG